MSRSTTPQLATDRLLLEPLRVEHAVELEAVLADDSLYEFTGGEPPRLRELEERYRRQVVGSGSTNENWHNWVARRVDTGEAAGFVQATVVGKSASVAWLIGRSHQRRGYASEAATAMIGWLSKQGISHLSAHIHPDHQASNRVAESVGFSPTGELDADGEQVWLASQG